MRAARHFEITDEQIDAGEPSDPFVDEPPSAAQADGHSARQTARLSGTPAGGGRPKSLSGWHRLTRRRALVLAALILGAIALATSARGTTGRDSTPRGAPAGRPRDVQASGVPPRGDKRLGRRGVPRTLPAPAGRLPDFAPRQPAPPQPAPPQPATPSGPTPQSGATAPSGGVPAPSAAVPTMPAPPASGEFTFER